MVPADYDLIQAISSKHMDEFEKSLKNLQGSFLTAVNNLSEAHNSILKNRLTTVEETIKNSVKGSKPNECDNCKNTPSREMELRSVKARNNKLEEENQSLLFQIESQKRQIQHIKQLNKLDICHNRSLAQLEQQQNSKVQTQLNTIITDLRWEVDGLNENQKKR